MHFFALLGVWGLRTSQYLVWPPFASCSATHLLRIEFIRLSIVACGMLVHSSSMAVRSCWRRLMVEKWTFNARATDLVDIPAVSMPIARSLNACGICGILLWDKTAHFRVAFYCGQSKAHLCTNHDVRSASWCGTPVRWDGLSQQSRSAHYHTFRQICEQCLREMVQLCIWNEF